MLVTGHTGFKGGWLALWLHALGAEVHGFALPPPTTPSFYEVCRRRVADCVEHASATSRASAPSRDAVRRARPEIVFHLAAQPLVRDSYDDPLETFRDNVMGTRRTCSRPRGSTPGVHAVVIVTTDKCYENREWVWPYRENEPLGGHDPYSRQQGLLRRLVSAAYRAFVPRERQASDLATARAGNVIGGGDWAPDRLVPDFLRALDAGSRCRSRSPAVGPALAARARAAVRLPARWPSAWSTEGAAFADAWNFGPDEDGAPGASGSSIALCAQMPGARGSATDAPAPHEAHTAAARQLEGAGTSRLASALGPRRRRSIALSPGTTPGAAAPTWPRSAREQIAEYEAAAGS